MSATTRIVRPRGCTYILTLVTCLASLAWSQSPLRQNQTWPSRVYPGHLWFPTSPGWSYFGQQLDGYVITPLNSTAYLSSIQLRNRRLMRHPAVVVKAKSIEDVQRSILFARRHNLHLTIRSSGHDFIGRSSHDGSLNLDLRNMNEVKVSVESARNPAGEATVQSGASWLEVYREVDKVFGPDETGQKTIGRVIVGAYCGSVAVGGYAQGGGHSPIGRKFGLAVDNLLGATIVTADGKVHTINETLTVTRDLDGSVSVSNDTSLFWAIRGGGAGTWGVVISYTFKLHYAPERFRSVLAIIPTLDRSGKAINKADVEFAFNQISLLSPDWGGYVYMIRNKTINFDTLGSMVITLNHEGSDSSPSNQEINALLQHPSVVHLEDHRHRTFLDYVVGSLEVPNYETYAFSTFTQPDTLQNVSKRKKFVELVYDMVENNVMIALTLIGGNMANVGSHVTPMHQGMRSGVFLTLCMQGFQFQYDPGNIDMTLTFAQRLYTFGLGSYFNEPAEDLLDWKRAFWDKAETYLRLLDIKKKVDPTNFFWCHNCVGSDLGHNYGSPDFEGLPGQAAFNYFNTSRQFDEISTYPSPR